MGDRRCNLWLEEAEIRGRFEGNLAPWPASAFCRGPRGLPVNGGDERLEAYSPDDLFESAVPAVRGNEEGVTVTCGSPAITSDFVSSVPIL